MDHLNKPLKFLLRLGAKLLGGVFILIIIGYITVQLPAFQRYITGKAESYLREELHTEITVGRIEYTLFKSVTVREFYVEDRSMDTLLYFDKLKVTVNVTDLFYDKVVFNSIAFDELNIQLNRPNTDSLWNYQFVVDAFSAKEPIPDIDEKKPDWIIGLEELTLNNSRLSMTDLWDTLELNTRTNKMTLKLDEYVIPSQKVKGATFETTGFGFDTTAPSEQLNISMGEGSVNLLRLDLEALTSQVKKISLSNSEIQYQQKKINPKQVDNSVLFDTPWQITIDELALGKLDFKYDSPSESVFHTNFDSGRINIKELNTAINAIYIDKYHLRADIDMLSAREGNEFVLNNLSGKIDYNPKSLEVTKLNVATPHSSIQAEIGLKYDELTQLYQLSDRVDVLVDLDRSKVGSNDVSYFLPDINHEALPLTDLDEITIESVLKGSFANLDIESLKFYDKGMPLLSISGKVLDIKQQDKANFDINLHAFSSLIDKIETLYPAAGTYTKFLRQSELEAKIKGDLSYLNLISNVNTIAGRVFINGDYKNSKLPIFKLNVSSKKLNVGRLIGVPKLGTTDFNILATGKGGDLKTMVLNVEGQVDRLYYANKTFGKLKFHGGYNEEMATLNIKSSQTCLDFDLDATVNFTTALPVTESEFTFRDVELQSIGLTEDDIRLAGVLTAKVIGTDLDSLDIALNSDQFKVTKNDLSYEFSPAKLRAATSLTSTSVKTDFPFLKGYFIADYSLIEIQEAFNKRFLPKLLNNKSTQQFYNNHHFELAVTHLDPTIFEDLLIHGLNDLDFGKLQIAYNGDQDHLKVLVDIPQITYEDIEIDTLLIAANSIDLGYDFSIYAKEIKKGNLHIPTLTTYGTSVQGNTKFSLGLNDAENQRPLFFKAEVNLLDSGFQLHLLPDSLRIGYADWNVDVDNRVLISDQGVYVERLALNNDIGAFEVKSIDDTLNSPIQIDFQQLELETLSKILDQEATSFKGILDGNIVLRNIQAEQTFTSLITVRNFAYGTDTVGRVDLKLNKETAHEYELDFSIEGKRNDIKGTAYYQTKASQLQAKIQIKRLDLATIESYMQGQIERLSGSLTGDITLSGPLERPEVEGQLNITNTAFNTAYLGTYLQIEKETLLFKNNQIQFNNFLIKDASGNPADINGTISSENLESYIFNLHLNSHKFQLLNTKSTGQPDERYYGQLFMSSDVYIKGTSDLPEIDANVKIIEGSDVTVVVLDSDIITNDYTDVVTFVSQKKEKLPSDSSKVTPQAKLLGVRLQANLELLPEAKLKILIDPDAGDNLTVQGKAELSYTIDESGQPNLSGTYEVTNGIYDLTFYNFLKKQFIIEKGSRIVWTGDPYDAQLAVKATHIVNASTLPLIESQLTTTDQSVRNAYKQVLPFNVSLDIGGQISSPRMGFNIDLPADKQNFQGGIITNKLVQLNSQESELNKQVFSLLLFNRFITDSSSPDGGNDLISNTARNSVSKLLADQLNSLSDKYIKVVKVQLDLESFQDFSSGSSQARTDLKLELSRELFHEKLVVNIGGNVTLEGDQNQNGVRNLAQDITLTYRLDDDGVYRLKAFRKNEFEGIVDGEIIKTGVGITLSTEFDNWSDFLRELKSKKQNK